MRKLILKMSVSIDGFVCGPNGEVDWIFRTVDDEAARWTLETLWDTDLHIMGRRTYQDMAAYWPTSKEPFAEPMNKIPKIAFSKRGFLDKPGIDSTTRAFKDAASFVKGSSEPEALQTDNKQEGNWVDPQFYKVLKGFLMCFKPTYILCLNRFLCPKHVFFLLLFFKYLIN